MPGNPREIRFHLEMMIEENITRGYDSNIAVEKVLEYNAC